MVQAGWPPTRGGRRDARHFVRPDGPRARRPEPLADLRRLELRSFEALWARARAIRSPAPPAFASLRGTFGLVSADECWLQLLADDAAPGRTSFTTTAVVLASSDPATFPDEESVRARRPPRRAPPSPASPPLLPRPRCACPCSVLGSVACELTDGPVVCFEGIQRRLPAPLPHPDEPHRLRAAAARPRHARRRARTRRVGVAGRQGGEPHVLRLPRVLPVLRSPTPVHRAILCLVHVFGSDCE